MADKIIYPYNLRATNCRNCRYKEKVSIYHVKHDVPTSYLTCKEKHVSKDTNACRYWRCNVPGMVMEINETEKFVIVFDRGYYFKVDPYGKVIQQIGGII